MDVYCKLYCREWRVGRSKICTIVPSNHFGPIPGLEVGTMWMFRVQVSEHVCLSNLFFVFVRI